jgi:putative peptidoglycan lipid II flippase
LTVLALPILFFSGSVILGNAVLNAMGKVVITGVAQLVVPIVAIFAVFTYGETYGVHAAMIGMVVGQLMNLLILQLYTKKNGYSLIPQNDFYNSVPFGRLALQYVPLIASAFFVSVAILVDTLLAMTLPEGGVSVFNLGNKVVLLVTGLVGAAISTVMLPYFSSLIAKNNVVTARRELSVFLLFITFFSVPISVVLFVWAKQIVGLIFEGGHIGETEVDMVARVMQYAVVQIPFFACNVLLLKFSTATKHVVLVAVLGLFINVGASLVLMKHMGVAGIALGASFSMVIATISLVMILVRFSHVGFFDAIVLLLNWLLFLTFLLSVHFGSMSGIVVTLIAFLTLLMGYIQSLINDKRQTLQVA